MTKIITFISISKSSKIKKFDIKNIKYKKKFENNYIIN